MTRGSDGTLWALGLDGLYRGAGHTWTRESTLEAAGLPRIVIPGRAGNVRIGTSAGLWLCHGSSPEPADGVLGRLDIHALLTVRNEGSECLWIGTDRGLFTDETEEPIVEDRTVTALAWDASSGVLWVGSDRGLLRLSQECVVRP